jgi:hypothetical protein
MYCVSFVDTRIQGLKRKPVSSNKNKVLAPNVALAHMEVHDLNLTVTVKVKERGQHVLIPADYLVVCTQGKPDLGRRRCLTNVVYEGHLTNSGKQIFQYLHIKIARKLILCTFRNY